jgi:hypothetical protein
MTELEDIRVRMQNICDFIASSITDVDAGLMVNLSGLDDNVAALCERTISLPPDEAQQIQPLMAEMINNLDRLGKALRDYQVRVRSGQQG